MANKKVKFELTAVDKTKAAFDKVTKGLKGIGSVATGASKGIAGIGLAATASATALALIVDRSYQAVDAIGKTATQTGIATDTLQAFHLAARESGTTIEGANTALIKFARSIGDAERGLKTQADIFKNIGVELRDTSGRMRSFDAILEDTAKGIMELGSQSERAAALANLFGRQGVILTGAITDLSENGIKKFIDRAKELGIVLSEKVIRRTEDFNDAIGVIKMQIGSFVNNITTSFLPLFEKMREKIALFIQDSINEAGGMDALGVKIANTVIEFVAKSIEHFGLFSDGVATMVNDIKITLNQAAVEFFEFQIRMLEAIPFSNFEEEIFNLHIQAGNLRNTIFKLEKNTTSYGEKAKKVAGKLREKKLTVDELRDSTKGLGDNLGGLGNSFTNLLSPTAKFLEQINDVNTTIENAAVSSMKKMEDTILDGIKTGKLAFEDFANFVVEQLMRIAIQQMVIKPIATSLFGSLPSFDGGGFTGTGVRAGGLDGKGGSLAVVHPNETVVDHTKGQSASGSATVNFNISTVDATGFDQLLSSRKGLITQIINNAMNTQGKMGIV